MCIVLGVAVSVDWRDLHNASFLLNRLTSTELGQAALNDDKLVSDFCAAVKHVILLDIQDRVTGRYDEVSVLVRTELKSSVARFSAERSRKN